MAAPSISRSSSSGSRGCGAGFRSQVAALLLPPPTSPVIMPHHCYTRSISLQMAAESSSFHLQSIHGGTPPSPALLFFYLLLILPSISHQLLLTDNPCLIDQIVRHAAFRSYLSDYHKIAVIYNVSLPPNIFAVSAWTARFRASSLRRYSATIDSLLLYKAVSEEAPVLLSSLLFSPSRDCPARKRRGLPLRRRLFTFAAIAWGLIFYIILFKNNLPHLSLHYNTFTTYKATTIQPTLQLYNHSQVVSSKAWPNFLQV